jgi:hypothetical protein
VHDAYFSRPIGAPPGRARWRPGVVHDAYSSRPLGAPPGRARWRRGVVRAAYSSRPLGAPPGERAAHLGSWFRRFLDLGSSSWTKPCSSRAKAWRAHLMAWHFFRRRMPLPEGVLLQKVPRQMTWRGTFFWRRQPMLTQTMARVRYPRTRYDVCALFGCDAINQSTNQSIPSQLWHRLAP